MMLCKTMVQFLAALALIQVISVDHPLYSEHVQAYSDSESENYTPIVTLSLQLNTNQKYSNLSDCWTVSLLNHLIAKRLFLMENDPIFNFSNSLSDLEAQVPMKCIVTTLPEIIGQIEDLENNPFNEYELAVSKAAAYEFLEQFQDDIADVHAEEAVGLFSSLEFFDQSVQCLKNIRYSEYQRGDEHAAPLRRLSYFI